MTTDLRSAARRVLRSARHVCVLTGAGISAESGIPTFRDALTGLWSRFKPEELATLEAFERNPQFVWEWYESRRAKVLQTQPNAGHYALAELARLVPKLTLVTQNVDGLHQRAGSPGVLEYHGNILRDRCMVEQVVADRAPEAVGRTAALCRVRRPPAARRRLVRRGHPGRAHAGRRPRRARLRRVPLDRHLVAGLSSRRPGGDRAQARGDGDRGQPECDGPDAAGRRARCADPPGCCCRSCWRRCCNVVARAPVSSMEPQSLAGRTHPHAPTPLEPAPPVRDHAARAVPEPPRNHGGSGRRRPRLRGPGQPRPGSGSRIGRTPATALPRRPILMKI